MESIYKFVGISRQRYFQLKKRQENTKRMMIEIEDLVTQYRVNKDRRSGSRSLYYNLNIKSQYDIGVNKFESLMSEYGLTLAPLKVRVITTQSSLQSWNYPDLTPGLIINNINRLVVGDLTYIAIDRELFYLFCLTDLYSARIVGFHFGKRMRAKDAKNALDKWYKLRGKKSLNECIHHTDGGSQYFSELYLNAMIDAGLQVSVSKNCLDNAYAEQRNGLIKHHLIPTIKYKNIETINKEIKKILYFYNSKRKQEALGWLSPVEYEKKWKGKIARPVLKLYDRSKGERSRRGFL